MGTQFNLFYFNLKKKNLKKKEMANIGFKGRPKTKFEGLTQKRGKTGYRRFLQDNIGNAKDIARAAEEKTSAFSLVSAWWKEIEEEDKKRYAKDPVFVLKYEPKTTKKSKR